MLIDELLGFLINVLYKGREEFPCNHFVNTCNIEYQFVKKKKNYNKPLIYFGMKAFLVEGTFFGLKIKILI